jgi:hypothetical protein
VYEGAAPRGASVPGAVNRITAIVASRASTAVAEREAVIVSVSFLQPQLKDAQPQVANHMPEVRVPDTRGSRPFVEGGEEGSTAFGMDFRAP